MTPQEFENYVRQQYGYKPQTLVVEDSRPRVERIIEQQRKELKARNKEVVRAGEIITPVLVLLLVQLFSDETSHFYRIDYNKQKKNKDFMHDMWKELYRFHRDVTKALTAYEKERLNAFICEAADDLEDEVNGLFTAYRIECEKHIPAVDLLFVSHYVTAKTLLVIANETYRRAFGHNVRYIDRCLSYIDRYVGERETDNIEGIDANVAEQPTEKLLKKSFQIVEKYVLSNE